MRYIAVLMTVYNRKETTVACLRNLWNQEMPEEYSMEVFMTNDGCTDGTPEAVAEEFPEVHIIQGDGNLYWNRGMIAAWEEAVKHRDYDFYLWLNDDTILHEGAVKRLLECSASQGDKALLVGSMTDTAGNDTLTYGGRDRKGNLIVPDEEKVKPCVLTNGNLLLVPRCVYNAIGMNDKAYTHS